MKLKIIGLVLTVAFYSQAINAQTETTMSDNFLTAVTGGDLAKVVAMLSSDPKLAASKNKKGQTATLLATYYGKKDIADVLIKNGIELDVFEAAATGQITRLRSLIANDKSLVNSFSPDGFVPLGLAIFFGHPETAMALLESGASVNLASKESMRVTHLHTAVAAHQILIARELVKRGANVNARSDGDFVPLHEASARGDLEFAKLLLDNGADINAKTKDGKSPLEFAVSANKPEMVKFLRERGAK